MNKPINKFQGRLNKEYGPSRPRTNKEINKFQGRLNREYGPAGRRTNGEINTLKRRLKRGREQWRVNGQYRYVKRRL